MRSCVCHFFFVPLQTQMIKNVVSMRKILSLLAFTLCALISMADTIQVSVSNYYSQTMARTNAFHLINEAGDIEYVFPVVMPEGATDIEYGKTYTLSEMKEAYAYWWYPAKYMLGALYTEATFKATKTGSLITRIEAQATDTNGDTWILTYDGSGQPEKPEGGTIQADTVVVRYASDRVEYSLETADLLYVFVFTFALSEGQPDLESGTEYNMLDMLTGSSSVGYFNIHTEIKYADVSFVKTVAEDGSYTIAATVLDEDGYTWNLTGSRAASPDPTEQHLAYDTPDEDFDFNFSSYDLNLDNLIDGYAVLTATDTVNKRMVYLWFWTRAGMEMFGAADYPIDYTKGDFTVNASTGAEGEGMTPSFVSTLAQDGTGAYLPNQLWLLVTGTVTVREDGLIIIEGQNSYGRTINAVLFPDDYQAVDNVSVDALRPRKVLQNGQILIIQNDRKFTIIGNRTY